MQILPDDIHNRTLVEQTHPSSWANPRPQGRYNLVAVGGGTAGLISAIGTAGLGGKAALIEKHLLGGDCLNYGCVPSKALIRAARAAYEVNHSERFGCRWSQPPWVDFAAVMERMRRLRAEISHHDSAERFRSLGVDVYLGAAEFTAPDRVTVAGQSLRFARAVICTGGRAAVPEVPGLAEAGYLTNETVFSLTELPRRLVVLGTGPIGCELAQAFHRFGSRVTLVGRRAAILPKEDPAAAAVVQKQFVDEGIELCLGWQTNAVLVRDGQRHVQLTRGAETRLLPADAILVAVGRRPNVEGLGLKQAGVGYNASGVEVDDRLRTSNPRVFAAGDICSRYQFTHAADAMARIAIRNALFLGRQRMSDLVIPRCTYTDPEIAQVGLTPAEAEQQGRPIDSFRVELAQVDRAVLDGDPAGFAVVHTRRGTKQVVGATIVAAHAGEMIGEITLLMTARRPLADLGRTIHCYPTQVEVLKRIADAQARTALTPLVASLFRRWLAWQRR